MATTTGEACTKGVGEDGVSVITVVEVVVDAIVCFFVLSDFKENLQTDPWRRLLLFLF